METRIQIDKTEPKAYQGMMMLENYLQESDINKTHLNLLKVRASQLNGCTYCINMHTKEALNAGEDQNRLFLLDAWQHTDRFTEEERAILQLTEEVTLIHEQGLTASTYEKTVALFNENYFSQLVMAITTINSWNRIAVSTHKPLDS